MRDAGRRLSESASWLTEYPDFSMADAVRTTGAEDVRWNLTDLFASADDPKIEATLGLELERARDFEKKYKGAIASLDAKTFATMMDTLAEYEESASRPEVYAYMLHSQDTQDHSAGRLLARVRE